ncbi:MAG: adenylate/guanylate cyclase domain-containing protein [Exiguobacterium indicum]
MKGNYQPFRLEMSLERMDVILGYPCAYEETAIIPKKHDLRFAEVVYVECAYLVVELRGTSEIMAIQNKPSEIMAKVYRAYISEIFAICNSFESCKDINIRGDKVSAVFTGIENEKEFVIDALKAASLCNGIINALNIKLQNVWGDCMKGIKAGIGVASGRALVMKAGHAGSGVEDFVYLGDVINKATEICGLAYNEYDKPICVTEDVYLKTVEFATNNDMKEDYQNLLQPQQNKRLGLLYTGEFQE